MMDIASKAGVSRATVSLVLNQRHLDLRISEETRQRILSIASELGYHPNELARAVVSGKNRMLGFLVHHAEAEATARMLAGALDAADAHGYSLKVLRLKHRQVDRPTIERCVELRLAAVMAIYLDAQSLSALHIELNRYAMPIAILEDAAPSWGFGVISDDEQAMSLAIAHLLAFGHRRIGLITLNQGTGPAREKAFRAAMRASGLAPKSIVRCDAERQDIEAAVHKLLAKTPVPTAIIGATDPIAMAVMRVARRRQVRVPEDLSVIGYGNLEMAEHADPRLSSIALPFFEIGAHAVRLLIERVEAASAEARPSAPLLLPASLKLRDSTARAKE